MIIKNIQEFKNEKKDSKMNKFNLGIILKGLNFHQLKKIIFLLIFVNQIFLAQEKMISITIDDVPNTSEYLYNNFTPILLNILDSLEIPFAIFINESKILQTDSIERNKALLNLWIENESSTIGNHTYGHLRYSNVGLDSFLTDVEMGERFTIRFANRAGKPVKYFRFPYNDLGKDSIQHFQGKSYLNSKGYTIAPFTIESSDWMFNHVYEHYLKTGQIEKAKNIGEMYKEKTMQIVEFFEKMSLAKYGRNVKHIYLCHDNKLNADYLTEIISELREKDYQIISLDEALTDPIYAQENRYYKKWGISWMYRWIEKNEERLKWMRQEISLNEIQELYETFSKVK